MKPCKNAIVAIICFGMLLWNGHLAGEAAAFLNSLPEDQPLTTDVFRSGVEVLRATFMGFVWLWLLNLLWK